MIYFLLFFLQIFAGEQGWELVPEDKRFEFPVHDKCVRAVISAAEKKEFKKLVNESSKEELNSLNLSGHTALMAACYSLYSSDFCIHTLLDSGKCDINKTSEAGEATALSYLVNRERDISHLLGHFKRHNPDITIKSREGYTVLQGAAENRNPNVLLKFLELWGPELKKARLINYQNEIGQSALHSAALRGNTLGVLSLIELGADPNIVTFHKNYTPLMFTTRLSTMVALLENGALTKKKSEDGHTGLWQISQHAPVVLPFLLFTPEFRAEGAFLASLAATFAGGMFYNAMHPVNNQ